MREICDALVERSKVDGSHSFMSGGINGIQVPFNDRKCKMWDGQN
ncbi:predicted protein [Sclerotinia sclerotiorum 1980 UF-70]|uniref:Uncharacterized protein n=1 Tax=Sclerotinia sclerotiorum (strain ATCC 18683 / 1980 / Ss-1) TaxID=665079 RepID=A7F4W0_SCLS1|nr:predicted protein [Sclerotinia sclerotiorum 1980 UF-70]EDN97781.1 predicted protein [Sclerotinia sclerotiorum 1980 UF-70]